MNILLALTEHFQSDYSLILAFMDFVPVILYLIMGIILLRNTYSKIEGIGYSSLSIGVAMVFLSGCLKAIWKMICSLGICDFAAFNLMFFPLQMFGYIFFMIGSIYLIKKKKNEIKMNSLSFGAIILLAETALELKNTSLPFLIIETLASSVALIVLSIFALKNESKLSFVLIILSFVFMWGMGGLAALDGKMNVVLWNWIEEIVNTLSQAFLLSGIAVLNKKDVFKRLA